MSLTADQLESARIIVRECAAASGRVGWLPRSLAIAALANAWAESRLNRFAAGDSGGSIGLFQLSSGGAGRGMTVAARQDPTTNTRVILAETLMADRRTGAISAAMRTGTVGDLAAAFCRHVERPRDWAGESRRRYYMTRVFGVEPSTLCRDLG